MNLQLFSHNLNDLEITTNSCLKAVSENDLQELDTLLVKRKEELELLENLLKDDPFFFKQENDLNDQKKVYLIEIKNKFKKIIKDNKILADNISREKEKSLSEIKKLKIGKETLSILKKKMGNKRIFPKII